MLLTSLKTRTIERHHFLYVIKSKNNVFYVIINNVYCILKNNVFFPVNKNKNCLLRHHKNAAYVIKKNAIYVINYKNNGSRKHTAMTQRVGDTREDTVSNCVCERS